MNKAECIVVSGGFDPIHVGHLKMFKEASELAPKLIVIVNDDNFLIEKKGYVFMPLAERVEIIEGFGVVDMVVESTDADTLKSFTSDGLPSTSTNILSALSVTLPSIS